MSTVYKFRITFDDYDDVSRDIEIKSTQVFEELHYNLQSSIGFDASKPASFYMSNDNWIKGQEISLEKKTDKNGNPAILMKDAKLCNYIADPHQKIIYHFDYDSAWLFRVELIKILPQEDSMRHYPVCVKTVGDAPKQYLSVPIPKIIEMDDDDAGKSLLGNIAAIIAGPEAEIDEAEEESNDDLLIDTEEGVDEEDIAGMGEEGEESEEENQNEESEMGFADGDDQHEEEL